MPTPPPFLSHHRLYFSLPKWTWPSFCPCFHSITVTDRVNSEGQPRVTSASLQGPFARRKRTLAAGLGNRLVQLGQSCRIIHHWERRGHLTRVRLAKQLRELTTNPLAASSGLLLNLVAVFLQGAPGQGRVEVRGSASAAVHAGVTGPHSGAQGRGVFY